MLKFPAVIVALVAIAFAPFAAQAAEITWSGASNTTFSTAGNWVGGVAPANSLTTDTAVFGASLTANQPNLTANRSLLGIKFLSPTGGWTVNGAAYKMQFGANSTIDDSANMIGVTTFNSLVQFEDANSTTTINGGGMGGGNINMAGNVIALRNHALNVVSGMLTISNWDGNAGYSFSKSGSGTMVIKGAGTNTGAQGFGLNAGTLIIGNKSSLGGGTFGWGTNATLKASVDLTGANAITNGFDVTMGNDGARLSGANSVEFTGTGKGSAAGTARIINNLDSGKTLTLGNIAINTGGGDGRIFAIGGTGDTVINGVISNGYATGANSFEQSGRGTTTLNGANTYTGNTQVAEGTLTLKTATGSLASTKLKLYSSSGTFNADNAGASGAKTIALGALDIASGSGSGTIKITRSADYNQVITFSNSPTITNGGWALNFVNTGGTASAANGFVITNQAAGLMARNIFYNGTNFAWYDSGGFVRGINYGVDAGSVTSAGGTTVSGTNVQITGAITAQQSATFTTLAINGGNNITLSNGQTLTVASILKVGNNAATISGGSGLGGVARDGTRNNDLVVRVDQAGDALTIDASIGNDNTTSLLKTGLGTLTLSRSNAYNGSTMIYEGTVSVSSNANLGTVTQGADVSLSGGTLQATATFALDNAGANARKVSLNGYNNTIDVTGNNALTINGVVANGGSTAGNPTLRKSGTGTLVLGGSNTYGGDTVISAGTLQVGTGSTSGSLAATAVSTIENNATLAFNRSDTVTQGTHFANFIRGTGQLVQAGAGTLVLAAGNSYTGDTVVNSGILSIATPAAISSSSGVKIANGAGFTYTGANSTVLDRNITITSGTGTLRNSGGQTLTLSGTLTKNGTVLNFGQGAFNVTGTITGASANSDLLVDSATVTLNNANSYNGPTYIRNGGALTANVTGALPTSTRSAVSMDDSGTGSSTLTLGANQQIASLTGASSSSVPLGANALTVGTTSGTTTFAGVIGGSGGSLVKDGNSTQILSGNNTYSGGTTISAGTLQIGAGGTSGSIASTSGVTNNGILAYNRSDSIAASYIISGTGALTKSGAGTLTLSGANTYSGATTISEGEIALSGSGKLSTSTALNLSGSTSRLDISGISAAGSTNGSLAGETGSVVNLGSKNLNVGGNNTSTTFAGILTNTGSLTKSGTGTLLLAGDNTFSGGMSISGGTLRVGDGGTAGTLGSGNVTNTGGTLVFNRSDSIAVANIISGGGPLTQAGSGTLTLTATNTYNGATTVEAGKLVVNGSISNSAVTVKSTAALGGSGTVGSTTVINGGVIAPGNSPGTLTINGDLAWNNGGGYDWEIFSLVDNPGTSWDLLSVTGTLNLTNLTGAPDFKINLYSLNTTNSAGPLAGWLPADSYEWKILQATNAITGFNTNYFTINTANFSAYNTVSGLFALELRDDDRSLYLTYTGAEPVPEPGTWGAAALLAAAAIFVRWRRRNFPSPMPQDNA